MGSADHRHDLREKTTLSRRRFLYLAGLGLAGAAAAACSQAAAPAPTAAPAKPAPTAAPAAPAPAAPTAAPAAAPAVPQPAPTTAPAAKAPTAVKLVDVEPLTGPSGGYGQRVWAGVQIAVKEINDAGGFKDDQGNAYTIQISSQDMANSKDEAIALLRQSASDPSILAQLGPISSVGFIPCVPVAGQLKMPLVGTGSNAPIADWNPYVVRLNPVTSVAMPLVIKAMVKKLSPKKVAFIYDQTQDAQVGGWQASKKTVQDLGLQDVADTVFRANDQDFSAQVASLKAAGPDTIGVFAAIGDAGKVCLQIRDGGLSVPLFMPDGAFLDVNLWDNTQGKIKGDYTFITMDLAAATGALKNYLDLYTKLHPDLTPTQQSISGYDAVYTVVAAIKKAGSATDREKFRQAMDNLDFTTPLGNRVVFKNPPNGENLNPVINIVQVTDRGKYVVVPQ